MARRSQCSSAGDNPLHPNYLPPHYREEYRLAIDALIEEDLEGYYQFLQKADVVDFLSSPEIQYIQNSVQDPQQSNSPEQHFQETGVDGSSDTYWPLHSDLDAPGLDLGWPQLHHFVGPTEVTTLVNPPEPDMPSIKEQARRLIKNAQQVIAIVMDMFTDVDMFADILDAAMRNVAVYVLLDQQNAHHFVNMVSNCRVDVQNVQLLRVRTVSGITYHCRSGKSFKGQMMDRFLLTDCRAVLSGNYSFMWSFEKLNRCMAHLFLGQLVSTFDEEFRILFAQSQPLVFENVPQMEEYSLSQKRQYPSETAAYRETKKFQSLDTAYPEEWPRHSYDERMDTDWRMMPLKKQESLRGPADMYNRFPSQYSRMDPPFDQGPSRMPMMENLAFKRHSYAEGAHGRYSYPFLQHQGMPEPENQERLFHRGQQPGPGPGPGKEADYSGYDKFWDQDFHAADQYSDPGLPQEMEPTENFDPVLNYLLSTRNADLDQGSEKLLPAADLPFGSSYPRRLSLGQPHVCQTSPTPSNPTDQKPFYQEPYTDHKDPMVKRGLRNWRISSYLSAYDNSGDEGIPSAPPNAPDPFEDQSNPIQHTPGIDLSLPKIPNVREFKIPAVPRASQMPSYAKNTAREQPKNVPDEPTAVATETKTTPTSSESSSTAEMEKIEEAEQKEPKTAVLRREESFRRKYNAAVPRSSRLRSSLIFSSLEQQHTSQDTKTAPGQQDEESDKNDGEQTKLPFVSQMMGQRRSTAREPFEWSRYMKSATFDNSASDPSKPDDENSKPDDKDSPKGDILKDLSQVQESLKQPGEEQANSSPSMPRSKPSEAELSKTDQPVQPHKSLLTTPLHVDMNDPDNRLMFFKELAAKRKAAKAAEAEKSKEKDDTKLPTDLKDNTAVKKEEPVPKETSEKNTDASTSEGLFEKNASAENAGKTVSTEACSSVSLSLDASDKTAKQDSQVKTVPSTVNKTTKQVSQAKTDPSTSDKTTKQDSQVKTVPSTVNKTPKQVSQAKTDPSTSDKTTKQDSQVKTVPSTGNKTTKQVSQAKTDPSTSDKTTKQDIHVKTDPSTDDKTTKQVSQAKTDPSTSDKTTKQDSQVKTDPSTGNKTTKQVSQAKTDPSTSDKTTKQDSQVKTVPSTGNKTTKQVSQAKTDPSTSDKTTKQDSQVKTDPSTSDKTTKQDSQVKTDPSTRDKTTKQDSRVKTDPSTGYKTTKQDSKVQTDPNIDDETTKQVSQVKTDPSTSDGTTKQDSQDKTDLRTGDKTTKQDSQVKTDPSTGDKTTKQVSQVRTDLSTSDKTNKQDSQVKTDPNIDDKTTKQVSQVRTDLSTSDKTNKQDSQVKTDPNIDDKTTKQVSQVRTDLSTSDKTKKQDSQVKTDLSTSDKTTKQDSQVKTDPNIAEICEQEQTRVSTNSEKIELKISQLNPAVKTSIPSHPPIPTKATLAIVPPLAQCTDESESPGLDSTSKESSSLCPSSVEAPPSSAIAASNSNTHSPESVPLETSTSSPLLHEQHNGSEYSSSSDHILPDSGSKISPSPSPSSCALLSTPAETISSHATPEDSILTSSVLSPNEQESVSPSQSEPFPLTSSETLLAADSAHVEADISPDTRSAGSDSETHASIPSEKDVPEKNKNISVAKGFGEESEDLALSKDVKADSIRPSPSSSLPESCLHKVSDLESKSRSAQNVTIDPSQSERQATPPSELNVTGSVTPTSADTVSCSSPLTVGSVLSPESEKTLAALHSPSDKNCIPKQITTDANKTLMHPSTKPLSPTEPTSKVTTQSDMPFKAPKSVTSEPLPSETLVLAENSDMDSQNELSKETEMPNPGEKKTDDTEATNKLNKTTTPESVCNEKTNEKARQNNCSKPPEVTSNEVVPPSAQSKQPKSRYQSSTANVLSSSNLRDDTKLLLEQISANSQSRNEAAKESPVTDDEKEDKADKNAKREKEKGIRSFNRGEPKTSQERDKLLEKIQSMRKERKVYSRFEMAP